MCTMYGIFLIANFQFVWKGCGRRLKNIRSLKGHGHDSWSLFTISFYPKLLYISSMKKSLSRTTIINLIVHGIEPHTKFEERENKQKNKRVMQFYGKRKITLNYVIVYKHKWLVPMFTNKDFNDWYQLCLLFNHFQNSVYVFGWLSVRILLEFHVK